MTVGVGGSTAEAELAGIKNMRGDAPAIGVDERLKRIARAQAIMREKGIDALYLDVSSSMTYFTGLKFRRTERMHSAVLPARGEIVYISPAFEVEKLKTMLSVRRQDRRLGGGRGSDRHRHRNGARTRLSKRNDRRRRSDAVLHVRWIAPGRQRLHLRQCDRRDRRLPHDQVRAGARA